MTRLEVVPDDLSSLAMKLSTIHDNMNGAIGGVDGAAAHQNVVGALNHFSDKWDYTMGKISDEAGMAAKNLGSASTGYVNADDSLSQKGG